MVDSVRNRELVLPPGTQAFVLDNTKGRVSAYVGPIKNSLSETDQLVVWDPKAQKYAAVSTPEQATQVWALAEQGQYIVLDNPTKDNSHPPKGIATEAADLQAGRRVVVAGPATFPLWPGQSAETVDGHHLRHNQYVLVRVYDPEAARENWQSVVMAPQVQTPPVAPVSDVGPTKTTDIPETSENAPEAAIVQPEVDLSTAPEFTMGQLIVIPGTQVSFYMPSTGMEVVAEGGTVSNNRTYGGQMVRDAVTLETLEYCILLDENGQKRYVRGPAVVFPNPTEQFKHNDNGTRVFDALELNEQSGIYVKVIEDYADVTGSYKAGDELFITGKDTPIYFPRAEHNIITYGGKRKHHAIAVPAGEGRYVLNRMTGDVELHRGPKMLLPDPRTEVIVRRILDPSDVETMFPGNTEAMNVNIAYAHERSADASAYLENSEVRRSLRAEKGGRARFAGNEQPVIAASAALPASSLADIGRTSYGEAFDGDMLKRGTSYSPPRTITLDTKYEGAVAIGPWPGYAVMVTNKLGDRRVEVGPKVVLLEYDEHIMRLNLSTGRPKSDDETLKTGYLRTINNVVTDIVNVETRDLVEIEIEVSYRVNFEGETQEEQQKWFDIENYVQVLTDHCRSRLRNAAKRQSVLDFYTNVIDIVRDTILGTVSATDTDRPGLLFKENNMRVYDVEVLDATIGNTDIDKLLAKAQNAALSGQIELAMAEEDTIRQAQLQDFSRQRMIEAQKTSEMQATIEIASIKSDFERRIENVKGTLQQATEQLQVDKLKLESERKRADQEHELTKVENELDMERLTAETAELVKRMAAVSPGLVEALNAFGDRQLVEKIVTALGPAAMAAGVTTGDLLGKLFEGTAIEGALSALNTRPLAQLSD